MIIIKNLKLFTVNVNCKYHWSKLNRFKSIMANKKIDLSYANLSSADLRYADLRYANLRSADLRSADLSSADLRSADLSSADLSSADLSYANLSSANLRYANLSNLSYANLRSADLRSAKLKNINDKDVIINDFMSVFGLGSKNRNTLFFNTNIGIVIQCGCFYGTEKEFKKAIKKTHDNNQFAKEYLAMLKVVRIRFER
jgi:uncharacterized protein YjbI with pentapeptide repeats